MKTIIQLPENSTLIDIEEQFPNYILSYDLFKNTLTVISTNCSDVSPELFTLKLLIDNNVEEFIFNCNGDCDYSTDIDIKFSQVGK